MHACNFVGLICRGCLRLKIGYRLVCAARWFRTDKRDPSLTETCLGYSTSVSVRAGIPRHAVRAGNAKRFDRQEIRVV